MKSTILLGNERIGHDSVTRPPVVHVVNRQGNQPREVLDLIEGDATVWEHEPLEHLTKQGELAAFRHDGFWQPMDTLREKEQLETAWATGNAPWKVWK